MLYWDDISCNYCTLSWAVGIDAVYKKYVLDPEVHFWIGDNKLFWDEDKDNELNIFESVIEFLKV